MTENPSLWLGIGIFSLGAFIMATLSLRQTNNDDFGKIEEWDFEEEIQDAEMIVEAPKKKKTRKKTKK